MLSESSQCVRSSAIISSDLLDPMQAVSAVLTVRVFMIVSRQIIYRREDGHNFDSSSDSAEEIRCIARRNDTTGKVFSF